MQLSQPSQNSTLDQRIVNWGIIFSILVCLAIITMGGLLLRFEVAVQPANDPLFYEWQLKEANFWAQLTAWLGFAFHQLAVGGTIWYAQKHYTKYTTSLRPANWIALGVNGLFVVLHYFQTMFFYDALAQDIPSWTAQFAVALMLIVILGMETPRRGLFFGKKVPFKKSFIDFLKRNHGYFFSFAVIYTFWFHPMVPTWGHLVGFVHVILIMLQGSLMFTRVHLNRKWTFLLELLVLPHAFQVALAQGNNMWGMFLFGFATVFIVSQMHGLGLKPWVIRGFYALYVGLVLASYTLMLPLARIHQVTWIAIIDYLFLFILYGLFLIGAWVASQFKRLRGDVSLAGSGD
jgi:hypothetical protein